MQTLNPLLFDDYVVDIVNRCRAIQGRSRSLCHSEFASQNPVRLANLISDICEAIAGYLSSKRNQFESDPDNVLIEFRYIDEFIKDVGAHLRYVDGAITAKLPWSLTQPLEKLSSEFLPKATLMLRPQWKYNYSISSHDLGQYYQSILSKILGAKKAEGLFAGFPKDFHIISFPSIERKTALFHTDLGHEIGHLVAKDYLEEESRQSRYLIDLSNQVLEEVRKKQKTPLTPLEEEIAVTEVLRRVVAIRRRGLEELISDIFGVKLFGLAALLALFEMSLADPLDDLPDQETNFYPPWRTRLRLGFLALEQARFIPVARPHYTFSGIEKVLTCVDARVDTIRQTVSSSTDKELINDNWVLKIAYDSIHTSLVEVEKFLNRRFGGKFATSEDLYSQVFPLVHRLKEGILPNAIEDSATRSVPAETAAILNAAWFYRLSFLSEPFEESSDSLSFAQKYEILNRLTLKALELSHLQKKFITWTELQKQSQ